MKTEIQGDFLGYACRFRLPSSKCFAFPLKSAAIVFLVQLVSAVLFGLIGFSAATAIILPSVEKSLPSLSVVALKFSTAVPHGIMKSIPNCAFS